MASEINSNEVHVSAFQSRLPITECLRVKCEENFVTRNTSAATSTSTSKVGLISPNSTNNNAQQRAPVAPTNNALTYGNNNNTVSNTCNNGNGNSPKMGSRRIFTAQFKLQVLESYRNDSDCKGNQRATARKYNIHRRQIQKWLQGESNLRSSVANSNQNSVKHQFHNISHHQQQQLQQHQQTQPPRMPISLSTTSASLAIASGATNNYSHHTQHQHPHPQQLPQHQVPLDAARQTLALNSLSVPSMPSRLATSSSSSAQGVLAAANLAAAVAVAIASTSSPTTSTTSAVSPLRPTAIGGANGVNSAVAKLSPSLLHSHHHQQQHHHHHPHHQHFPLSPYTHSPVGAPLPVSVGMLSHHISVPPPQPHHALHQHYTYHNLSTHTQPHALHLSHQPSAFLPTTCLPVNVLSAVRVANASPSASATTRQSTAADMLENNKEESYIEVKAEQLPQATLSTATTTTTTTRSTVQDRTTTTAVAATTIAPVSDIALLTEMARRGAYNFSEPECSYGKTAFVNCDSMRETKSKNFTLHYPSYQYEHQTSLDVMMTTPMDLSVGPRRKNRQFLESDNQVSINSDIGDSDGDKVKCHLQESENSNAVGTMASTQVVDLTFRKRKVITTNSVIVETEQPQKLAKRSTENSTEESFGHSDEDKSIANQNLNNNNDADGNGNDNDDDDDEDVDIEVDVEAKQLSSKPIKLFKPYLLDNDDVCEQSTKSSTKSPEPLPDLSKQREPIIWSNHPDCHARCNYDAIPTSSSLHSPLNDKHTFHGVGGRDEDGGSPNFLTSKSTTPQSILSPRSAQSLSPASFPLHCPKGSPVSGYESSSSICSERDDTCSLTETRSYSVDFQMHTVCENKLTPPQPIHIRDWLEQDTNINTNKNRTTNANRNAETNTPPLARASIALYT